MNKKIRVNSKGPFTTISFNKVIAASCKRDEGSYPTKCLILSKLKIVGRNYYLCYNRCSSNNNNT